jgi:hypothetical protein
MESQISPMLLRIEDKELGQEKDKKVDKVLAKEEEELLQKEDSLILKGKLSTLTTLFHIVPKM